MEDEILVSIIIAAYNSENTIWRTLNSIKEQDFNLKQIEIIVVDGGSTDNTRKLAEDAGAKILDNPKKLPEIAKTIGLREAVGKYILIMDSDETFNNTQILKKRVNVLENIHEIKAIQGGYCAPENIKVGLCSHYINEVGDPFTCFVYKTYLGNAMLGLIMRKGGYNPECDCYIAKFEKDDIRPISDSVCLMNRRYIVDNYSDLIDQSETTAYIYDRIISDTGYAACVKGDKNYHYSSSDIKTYIKKLKFRVTNNIFDVKGSGYSAKAAVSSRLNQRKYLYPIYVISTVVPLVHGIYMSFVYNHPVFLLHPIFSWYVVFEIIFQYLKKIFNIKSVNMTYAK